MGGLPLEPSPLARGPSPFSEIAHSCDLIFFFSHFRITLRANPQCRNGVLQLFRSTMYPTNFVSFPQPKGGASLILSFRLHDKTTLILGSTQLAASRAFSALEADSNVIVIAKGGINNACDELRWRAQQDQLTILDLDSLPGSSTAPDRDLEALESYLDNTSHRISFICVTDTVFTAQNQNRRTRASAAQIYQLCSQRNIAVNTTDMPEFCDFSFTSTHRFEDPKSGERTSLQIGVSTNGQGCRLAGRVRREIVARLPKEVGAAVQKIGELRALAKAAEANEIVDEDDICEDGGVTTPNRPVPSRSNTETALESARRRMKWVAQVSEYWPLPRLATMTREEMNEVLSSTPDEVNSVPLQDPPHSLHSLSLVPSTPPGRILLVGSGPGHPSLLTLATHTALTKLADLVLSDKLVPSAVLALIPPGVQVRIAKKFPGNAEGAQNEMMEAAVEAARKGLIVVRVRLFSTTLQRNQQTNLKSQLKQGDPVVYGRAGEEVLYFRSHGFEPTVIPGVSSALAGPTFAGIPVTQRGVAESFIVCTGVGRAGKDVSLPGYERGRTLVILMGVARLPQVIATLLGVDSSRRDGKVYPSHTPIALIERASMPDQRVISSTLRDIVVALESVGEQRPPGILVVGWAVLALRGEGDVKVLEDGQELEDEERVRRWLGGDGATGWRVSEGIGAEWEGL